MVKSNFSFSFSIFKILVQQTHKNQRLFCKGLKGFADHRIKTTQILKFQGGTIENTVGEGENSFYMLSFSGFIELRIGR